MCNVWAAPTNTMLRCRAPSDDAFGSDDQAARVAAPGRMLPRGPGRGSAVVQRPRSSGRR